jgi:hypothetical protein
MTIWEITYSKYHCLETHPNIKLISSYGSSSYINIPCGAYKHKTNYKIHAFKDFYEVIV